MAAFAEFESDRIGEAPTAGCPTRRRSANGAFADAMFQEMKRRIAEELRSRFYQEEDEADGKPQAYKAYPG